MANDTTGNPWKLDTAGVIQTAPLVIKKITWTPTADGDDILIQDNSGGETWSLKAIAATSDEEIVYTQEINGSVNGFNLVTLDAGTVRVYQ